MINNPDYEYYVIVNGKIESGWEYQEDAEEHIEDLPPNQKGKIYSKRSVMNRLNLDPDDDNSWVTVSEESTTNNHIVKENNVSKFNRSKNEKVQRMDKILSATRREPLQEGKNLSEEGEPSKEALQDHGTKIYKILDQFNDSLELAFIKLEKKAKNLPEEAAKEFGLDEASLDKFSDELKDLLMDNDLDPGTLHAELQNQDIL